MNVFVTNVNDADETYRFVKDKDDIVVYNLQGVLILKKTDWILLKNALIISQNGFDWVFQSENLLKPAFSVLSFASVKHIFCKNFSELYDMLKDE